MLSRGNEIPDRVGLTPLMWHMPIKLPQHILARYFFKVVCINIYNMKYVKKTVTVDAVNLKNKTNIVLDDGSEVEGNIGDWLVVSETGEQFLMTDEEFKDEYEVYTGKPKEPIKRVTVKDAMDLYEEPKMTFVPPLGYYPQQGQPVQQPVQRRAPQPYDEMPQAIASGIPLKPTKPPIPKKKGMLGGLFGGKKRKGKSNEYSAENIQIV